MAKDPQHWTSVQVRALLQACFGGGDKHAVMFEVRNATGHAANRSIDAVTMSLWPSLGLELHGMEIKISRSDWLRELKKPDKASATFEYFDRWYLVAPRNVANMDEIPGPWGWLAPEGGRLVTLKPAPKNADVKPLDRKFLASMLRCGAKKDDALIEAAVQRAARETSDRLNQSHQQRLDAEVARKMRDVQSDADAYRKIRDALGDNVGWIGDQAMIDAIKLVISAGVTRTWSGVREIQRRLASASQEVEQAMAALGVEKEKP